MLSVDAGSHTVLVKCITSGEEGVDRSSSLHRQTLPLRVAPVGILATDLYPIWDKSYCSTRPWGDLVWCPANTPCRN